MPLVLSSCLNVHIIPCMIYLLFCGCCHDGHVCDSQDPQRNRSINCLLPLTTCLVYLQCYRLQEESFQVSYSSKVCGVFSNRSLPSILLGFQREQQWPIIFGGGAWVTLTNNSNRNLSQVVLEFSLDSLWLLWGIFVSASGASDRTSCFTYDVWISYIHI